MITKITITDQVVNFMNPSNIFSCSVLSISPCLCSAISGSLFRLGLPRSSAFDPRCHCVFVAASRLFQILGQAKPDPVGRIRLHRLWQGAQHNVQLRDMLHQLGLGPGRITAIKRHDIRVEISHPLDAQHACVTAGKAHGHLVLIVEALFEILEVHNDALIGPAGRAFLFHRRLSHALGHRFTAQVGRFGITVNLMLLRHRRRLMRLSGGSDCLVVHGLILALIQPRSVLPERSRGLPLLIKVRQMRDRFNQGQPIFALTNGSLEQRGKTFGGRLGRFNVIDQPRKRPVVIVNQLAHPRGQPGKGQLVTTQHQMILARQGTQSLARLQPIANRIRHRLGRIDPHIGADRGQDLIARNHQMIVPAPERGMFRRVPIAHVDVPHATAHRDGLALLNTGKAQRHRRHNVAEIERALGGSFVENRGIHARTAPIGQRFSHGCLLHIQREHPRKKPRSARRDQFRAKAALQPSGQTHVIGMMVRDNHAPDRFARQGAVHHRPPNSARLLAVKAGIDHRPSIAFIQRIDVHMVQLHRQRQAEPKHALGHFDGLAMLWRIRPRVSEARGRLGCHVGEIIRWRTLRRSEKTHHSRPIVPAPVGSYSRAASAGYRSAPVSRAPRPYPPRPMSGGHARPAPGQRRADREPHPRTEHGGSDRSSIQWSRAATRWPATPPRPGRAVPRGPLRRRPRSHQRAAPRLRPRRSFCAPQGPSPECRWCPRKSWSRAHHGHIAPPRFPRSHPSRHGPGCPYARPRCQYPCQRPWPPASAAPRGVSTPHLPSLWSCRWPPRTSGQCPAPHKCRHAWSSASGARRRDR
mmetsp:Transcript_29398/g.57409  ORF Transcript_29398/g.57409 Transcript_29398/m.57409 type:complete len:809 (-) Transcript_29398:1054-3480(-)